MNQNPLGWYPTQLGSFRLIEFNRAWHDFDPDAAQLQAVAPEKIQMTLNKASKYSIEQQIERGSEFRWLHVLVFLQVS